MQLLLYQERISPVLLPWTFVGSAWVYKQKRQKNVITAFIKGKELTVLQKMAQSILCIDSMKILKSVMVVNGPQRTACLAKGYNNDKYKWVEVLVLGKKPWNSTVQQQVSRHSLEVDTSSQDSSRNSNNKHRQYARIMYASQSRGACQIFFLAGARSRSYYQIIHQ